MEYPKQVFYTMFNSAISEIGNSRINQSIEGAEFIPDIVFLVNSNDVYYRSAKLYHTSLGIKIKEITSIEDMLDYFYKSQKKINRIQLIAHGNPNFLLLPIFKGQELKDGLTKVKIQGFRINDEKGLRAILRMDSDASPLITTNQVTLDILKGLRVFKKEVLIPFNLEENNTALTEDLNLFFDIIADQYHLKEFDTIIQENTTKINPKQKEILRDSFKIIEQEIINRIINEPSINTGNLKNSLSIVKETVLNARPIEDLRGVESAAYTVTEIVINKLEKINKSLKKNNDGLSLFRIKLNHFKSLINSKSIIDIRGCRIAQDLTYLENIQSFFGNEQNLPTITAPDWYQGYGGYNFLGVEFTNNNIFNSIDDFLDNGYKHEIEIKDSDGRITDTKIVNFSKEDVRNSFNRWKDLISYDLHIDHIKYCFKELEIIDFISSECWKLIPVLKFEAPRLKKIHHLNLLEILDLFKEIFQISTDNPLGKEINKIHFIIIKLSKLKKDVESLVGPDDSQKIKKTFNDIAKIAKTLKEIPDILPFVKDKPIVPNTETILEIKTSITNIELIVDLFLKSTLDVFFKEIRKRIAHPNFENRYYCNIGIPIFLQNLDKRHFDSVIKFFISANNLNYANRYYLEAARGWLKSQWKGNSRQLNQINQSIAKINNIKELFVAMTMSEKSPDGNPTNIYYCPELNYNNHIYIQESPQL